MYYGQTNNLQTFLSKIQQGLAPAQRRMGRDMGAARASHLLSYSANNNNNTLKLEVIKDDESAFDSL